MSDQQDVHIFWSDEDDGFIALAYRLPGLSAFGYTREEALKNITVFIAQRLELDAELSAHTSNAGSDSSG